VDKIVGKIKFESFKFESQGKQMALTDKEIQALKPREKRYKITDGAGIICS
jgi:hypothetical protein